MGGGNDLVEIFEGVASSAVSSMCFLLLVLAVTGEWNRQSSFDCFTAISYLLLSYKLTVINLAGKSRRHVLEDGCGACGMMRGGRRRGGR